MNNQIKTPRYEVEAGINGCLLIRDTHNSDLTSLTKHALGFLEQQSANQNLKRSFRRVHNSIALSGRHT